MARTADIGFGSVSGRGTWSYDGGTLTVVPAGCAPLVVGLADVSGLSGDDYRLTLALDRTPLILARLGGDGPGLRAALRDDWPRARARALCLDGDGEPAPFTAVARDAGGDAVPAGLLLWDAALLVAREGSDLDPWCLSMLDRVDTDPVSRETSLAGADGRMLTLSRMAAWHGPFLEALSAGREALSARTAAALERSSPAVDAARRALLGAAWPAGRLRSLAELESVAPGFEAAAAAWIRGLPRAAEGAFLLERAGAGRAWLALGRRDSREEADGGEDAGAAVAAGPDDDLLWVLAAAGDGWLLECLSAGDRATYRFAGDDPPVDLVSMLLSLPRAPRTAVFLPEDDLVGERAPLAAAIRHVTFLGELRRRFTGRIIHRSMETWKKEAGG
jgi:hypothetical protein